MRRDTLPQPLFSLKLLKSRIQQLSHNIAATERSIDTIVYQLFGLNAAEIALVERAMQR